MSADRRIELVERECRLDEAIFHAQVTSLTDGGAFGEGGGPDDDRDVGPLVVFSEDFQELQTIHYRHHEVEKDQCGLHEGEHLQRLLTIAGTEGFVSFAAEKPGDEMTAAGVIFDDKNR